MPTYYFNLRINDLVVEDDGGVVLPDLRAARAEALRSALLITGPDGVDDELDGNVRFEISSEDGTLLLEVPLRDASSPMKSLQEPATSGPA
ncbi:DUF6894 family protein [Rhizobium sp. YIM 134829]|uniref:DUF6894 family protein n=1 Tax=Rhizobium sp. YIM 134829 TaxID=3390453 RepID=UPI003979D834